MSAPRFRLVRAGENWFAKLPGGVLVIACEIDETTSETVVLRRVPDLHWQVTSTPYRFARSDVVFIEKLA